MTARLSLLLSKVCLVSGMLLLATAIVTPTPEVYASAASGDCVTTSTACNAGTCTTAATDCTNPVSNCSCKS